MLSLQALGQQLLKAVHGLLQLAFQRVTQQSVRPPIQLSLGRSLGLIAVLLAGLWLKQDESVQEVCF